MSSECCGDKKMLSEVTQAVAGREDTVSNGQNECPIPASAPLHPRPCLGSPHCLDTEAAGGELVFEPRTCPGHQGGSTQHQGTHIPSALLHLFIHTPLSFQTSLFPLKPNGTGCA